MRALLLLLVVLSPASRALADTAADAAASYRAGRALAAQKKYPEAVERLQTAVRLNPGIVDAYFWIGVCEFAQGHDSAAVSNLKQALAGVRDPKQAGMIHYDLGVLYLKGGDKLHSDAEYRTAVSLNPIFANRPIARHAPSPAATVPAPRSSPAPRPPDALYLIATRLLPALFVILMVVIFAVSRRRGAAAAAPLAAAPMGIDEFRRASASWSVEPELRAAVVPRSVRPRSPLLLSAIFFPFIYVAVVALAAMPSAVKHELVAWRGAAGTGTVLRKFTVRRSSKHGVYLENRLEFSYPSAAGELRAEAPTGDDSSIAVGQAVPIHFLESMPGWAALDDDFGFAARSRTAMLAIAGMGSGVSALIVLLCLPSILRQRRLVRWGRPCPAKITEITVGAKGVVTAAFCYESAGRLRHGRGSARGRDALAGEIVTALVDPDDPNSAAIYRDSSWRAVPASVEGAVRAF